MLNWFKNLLSIEERKASTIMLGFIIFCIIGSYTLFKTQTLPMPCVYIILGLGGYICGYNVIPQMMSSNNMYSNNYNGYGYGSSNNYGYNSGYSNSTQSNLDYTTQEYTNSQNQSQLPNNGV